MKGDMGKVVEELHTTTTWTEGQGESGENAKGMRTMYADSLSRQLPMSHASMLAWNCTWNRQALVDKALDATTNHLDGLDEGGLVEKANEAMAKMVRQGRWHPTEVKVIGAKKLQNGGVLYKLNNWEAAE